MQEVSSDDVAWHKAEQVADFKSFLEFVEALIADRVRSIDLEKEKPSNPYGPDAGGWENTSIETFLDAAVAWARDNKFDIDPGPYADNPWQLFAKFLYGGKIYE